LKDIRTSLSYDQSLIRQGLVLPVMEQFYTIQGEGAHTGKAAYFIRIGGCDVGCHWCDVKESWNPDVHPPMPLEEIVEGAIKFAETIVVTGGEPLTWNMEPLVSALQNAGKKVHVETSGAYPLTGNWNWITLSPKKTAKVRPDYFERANELKVIIHNRHDFVWAEEQAASINKNCRLYLQPEWSKREEMMPLIVDYILENPQWQVSLQTHKYLRIP
jgi:organic radical activating enzyme